MLARPGRIALPDAPAIILQLHGSILRLLCHRSGTSFDGVGSVARALRRSGHPNNAMKKKLEQLDIAAAWVRHANGPRAARLLSDVDKCLHLVRDAAKSGGVILHDHVRVEDAIPSKVRRCAKA